MRVYSLLTIAALLTCTLCGVLVGCSTDPAISKPVDATASAAAPKDPAPVRKEVEEPKPPAPSPLEVLRKEAKERFSLRRFDHFAERSFKGSVRIDLGDVSGRQHINGGWRAGWNADIQKDGNEGYLEVNKKTARVFFKHNKGGFKTLMIRMRGPGRSGKVGFFINNKGLKEIEVGEEWQDVTLEIPADATVDGENQLMMRFKSSKKLNGRKQYAQVSSVAILNAPEHAQKLPRGPMTQTVRFGDDARSALVAATPQTWTWRVQVPRDAPKLGLSFGALRADASLEVTVSTDKGGNPPVTFNGGLTDDRVGAWNEEVLDLSAVAGEVVELRISASGSFPSGQIVAWDASLYSNDVKDSAKLPQDPKAKATNVLIYLIDTLRYDKLGVYNSKSSVPTPNLDAFARDATIFDAAYDAENWTKPSTATILTSLYPSTHKAKEASSKLPASATMLSEHLQDEGFKTGSFIANGYVSRKFGFDQGWDYYTNYIRENKRTDAERVVDDALKWIDKNKQSGRFFAYLHTIDPHVPYSAPDEWKYKRWHAHGKGKYRGPIRPQNTANHLADVKTDKANFSKTDKLYLESLYDSEVEYNDSEFGRLIQGLKSRGLYDNTVIIVLVDHGEEFWDHGSVGHGHSVYDEMVHSPLFVRYPNMLPSGRRVPHVVGLAGVVPTTLDILGTKALPSAEGSSFLDVFDGIGNPRPRIAVSDFMYRKKGVRVGRYHWLTSGQGGELFDLETDRHEKKNLIKTHPIARAYARAHFGFFMGAKDKRSWWTDHSGKARKELEINASDVADIDPELQQQLEAMGYVEGATSEHSAQEDKKLMEKEDGQ